MSSFNIPAAQNRPHNFDVASESSKSSSSQQLAFSSRFFEDKDYHSAAQTDPCTRITCRTYEGAPCAPGSSSTASHRTEDEEDDLLLMGSGDEEGKGLGDVSSKTAAERRAAKRKMKRFRLTHTQTRRAKLKRLTIDDRESMLKSRALPEDFDTAQTLNYAYDTPLHGGLGGPSSFFHSSNPEYDIWRPFTTGRLSLTGETNGNISPTSVVSSLIDSSFSVPGTTSPISPSSERSHFFTPPTSHRTSPRTSGSLPRSSSFAALNQATRRRHGSPLQQRLVRSRASSSAFPMHHTTTPVEQAVHFPVIPLHAVQSEPYPQQTHITYNGNGPGGNPNTSTYHAAQHVTAGHAANDTAWPDLANHVHNTIIITSGPKPSCTICNPPAPLTEPQRYDLAQGLAYRQLPAPGSVNSFYRGGLEEDVPAGSSHAGGNLDGAVARMGVRVAGDADENRNRGDEEEEEGFPEEGRFRDQRGRIDEVLAATTAENRLANSAGNATGRARGGARGSLVGTRNVVVRGR
ncbi:MAG: hypothetical protein Q9172_005254 [Xanthocarpia lactea]